MLNSTIKEGIIGLALNPRDKKIVWATLGTVMVD